MKHLFVINPHAGGENHADRLAHEIQHLSVDSAIHLTTGHLEATQFVDHYCRHHPGEAVRFYACGGDGTLNEVASGTLPHPQAEVGNTGPRPTSATSRPSSRLQPCLST